MTDNEGLPLIEDPSAVGSVLDLCCGSGCLAILAANLFPFAEVDAVDLSRDALEVAKINVAASDHRDRLHLFNGDLFAPLKGKKYDFIITNPPYVDAELMEGMPPEYYHEPQMALGSGNDGLDITRRILKEAPDHLNEGGYIICEIGYGRDLLEAEYPEIEFLWLDTENSEGEVFWLSRERAGLGLFLFQKCPNIFKQGRDIMQLELPHRITNSSKPPAKRPRNPCCKSITKNFRRWSRPPRASITATS